MRTLNVNQYLSNNGMAAIINPLGEIEQKIDYGEAGYNDFEELRMSLIHI